MQVAVVHLEQSSWLIAVWWIAIDGMFPAQG